MTFLIVCGGSAGHINPAIAIAQKLRKVKPESKILFVGSDKNTEKKLIPEAGFPLTNIKMTGLRRGFSPGDIVFNIKTAKNLITAGIKSKKLLKEHKPDAVIGTGGSICYPVIKRAYKMNIPSFVLEPNATPGLAVRMIENFADKIFVSYKGQENLYKNPEKVIYTGTPLKESFITEDVAADPATDFTADRPEYTPLIVSYWGSMGATGMNEKIIEFIKLNIKNKSFNHIHAAGLSGNLQKIRQGLINSGVNEDVITKPMADIREYISDMPEVMKKADLILTRAGASTLGELAVMGKPAILIPSPNVTENHQEANAKKLDETGAAIMLLEKNCTGESLYNMVISIINDKEKLSKMSNAQLSLATPDAADKIVSVITG